MASLPNGVNAGVAGLTNTLKPMNAMAPDLATDVALSLLRDLDGEAVGNLANEVLELLRKLETGQVLIGDHGKPQLPEDLGKLMETVLDTIDIELALKVKGLMGETRDAMEIKLFTYIEDHPELVRGMITSSYFDQAARTRKTIYKLDTIENTLDDDEILESINQGISALDAQEIAETINRKVSLFNRIHDEHPEIARTVLAQIVQALDSHEVEQTIDKVANDTAAALKPIAPILLPPIIRSLADMLDTADDNQANELVDAVDDLRRSFSSRKEVA